MLRAGPKVERLPGRRLLRVGLREDMSTRHLEMLVWGPGRRKSKKTFSGQPKLPLGRLLRLASPTSVNPAGKIRQDRREKPNMNFLTSVVLGFHTTKTVLKRENDGSQKNLGRQMFENGRGRRCFAGFGSIWLGLVSARLALQTRRRRFFSPLRVAGSTR